MEETTNDVAAIRHLLEERVQAIYAKDLNALMSAIAPDIRSFDVLDPLQNTGSDTVRERAERWFTGYKTDIGYELGDLQINAADTLAFAHYLYHVSGTLHSGDEVSMWVRATTCFEQRDGTWTIVHEHQSVPFDVETGLASVRLKP